MNIINMIYFNFAANPPDHRYAARAATEATAPAWRRSPFPPRGGPPSRPPSPRARR